MPLCLLARVREEEEEQGLLTTAILMVMLYPAHRHLPSGGESYIYSCTKVCSVWMASYVLSIPMPPCLDPATIAIPLSASPSLLSLSLLLFLYPTF